MWNKFESFFLRQFNTSQVKKLILWVNGFNLSIFKIFPTSLSSGATSSTPLQTAGKSNSSSYSFSGSDLKKATLTKVKTLVLLEKKGSV